MDEEKNLTERAKEILKLRAMRVKVPEFMPKQKQLVEFARDAAKFIIKLQK